MITLVLPIFAFYMMAFGLLMSYGLYNSDVWFIGGIYYAGIFIIVSVISIGIYSLLNLMVTKGFHKSVSRRSHKIYISCMLLGINSATILFLVFLVWQLFAA